MIRHYSVLFDTSIATANTGDEIIMDSVRRELHKVLEKQFWITLPTQDYIGRVGRKYVHNANLCIVGGTNLLSSHYVKYRQWKVSPFDALLLRGKAVLMGVGWWQYQDQPDTITKHFYRTVLAQGSNVLHSVRDEYTKKMLNAIGITNVVNTCCPTMWCLEKNHCSKIPTERGESVVTTLTDYNKNPELDRLLLKELAKRYTRVIAWPQGVGDRDYMMQLGLTTIIEPGLRSLDQALNENKVDYVGTRLHAGVRSLQHGRRTIVVSVDNRATEIARDTGLTVVERNDVETLQHALDEVRSVNIHLPDKAIAEWKDSMLAEIARSTMTAGGF